MDFTIPEELRIMQDAVRKFVEQDVDPQTMRIEEEDDIPKSIIVKMRELGLFGLSIPAEYGGLGLSMLGECVVYEQLARGIAAVRTRMATNNGIGAMGIVYDGTEEQKKKYLPGIAAGDKIIAFALTEPDVGSDASGIKTFAERKGDNFVINGQKMFITNGSVADYFTVLCLTDRQKKAKGGITAILVDKNTPGFRVGKKEKKMGLHGSPTNELAFEDCVVPVANVIGGEPMIGSGFKTAMKVLDKGRLTLGAGSVGAAQKAMELAIAYSKQRVQFGQPICEFQLIKEMLAQMACEVYAGRQMVYRTAWERDQGRSITLEAAMCKLWCSEMVCRVADLALQVHGGMGYMTEYAIERIYRDARVGRIYEGSSEIQKLVIARELLKD
jgi:acyl-CoA dehydrogenase